MFKFNKYINTMRQLENLNKRLKYAGGNQEGRFINDKLNSLKKALLYSYQAATAVLEPDSENPREFRCLINPDKTKNDYDQKILSIPFEDICLNAPRTGKTSEGLVPTNVKGGDVFKWKETDTYWLVYLRFLEEDAYYRWDIRRCKETIDIDGTKYHIYVRGPVETTIKWLQKKGIDWNTLNYSLEIYVTKNEQTLEFFHRFAKIKVGGKQWEVKAIDSYAGDGIIQVLLGETFTNTIEDEEYEAPTPSEPVITEEPYIEGTDLVSPFSIVEYSIKNIDNPSGKWFLDNKRAKIISSDENAVKIEITSSSSGTVNLAYVQTGSEDIILPIRITSLI